MRFVETHVFTSLLYRHLTEEEYARLQLALIREPELGKVDPGTGGIRKVRWMSLGRRKRGGVRILYVWEPRARRFLMLFVFAKNERADLTPAQKRVLSRVVREELG